MMNIFKIDYCILCGKATVELGSICLNCKKKCQVENQGFCTICGIPIISEKNKCLRCRSSDFSFNSGYSLFEYKNTSREIFYQYKFKKKKEIGEWYAFLIDKVITEKYPDYIIVPSPYRKRKKIKKGWDQVEFIMRILNRKYNYNINRLLRRKESLDQKQLNSIGRHENLKGKIHLRRKTMICSNNYLFIDDIFTTGATAEECSRVLLDSGAKNIAVLTIAID